MDKKVKTFSGVVVSDKMDKSRVVACISKKKHPIYGKYVKTRKKYMIHDAENQSHIGDTVLFGETSPVSKRKRWSLIKILEKAEG